SLRGVRRRRRIPVPVGDDLRRPGLWGGHTDRDVRVPRLLGHRHRVRGQTRGAHVAVNPDTSSWLGLPSHGPGEVGSLQRNAPDPIRLVLNWGRRYSLWVFNFGLACCAIEFIAASMARYDFIQIGRASCRDRVWLAEARGPV